MSKEATLKIIFNGKNWSRESSPYGWRIHPITKVKKFHYGADFACGKVPVYALEDGIVSGTGYQKASAGNYVYVSYPRLGVQVCYMHLSQIAVKKGQKVKRGTKIGIAGTTGASTGVHLHIGVKKAGSWINADTWLTNYRPRTVTKPAAPTATVRRGNKGENVKKLQRCLNYIIKAGLKVDGSCGPATVKAIKTFQKKYKLKVDGIAGPKTIAKIKALI